MPLYLLLFIYNNKEIGIVTLIPSPEFLTSYKTGYS